ncbi:hypothetical protein O3P69_013356 [Scylla paramamosain]|uniref:Uncharacterized protein n=1 Tax=Scylla paramamosain TaxID=85552 RepID=A0AAW0U004_SCYPA
MVEPALLEYRFSLSKLAALSQFLHPWSEEEDECADLLPPTHAAAPLLPGSSTPSCVRLHERSWCGPKMKAVA